MDKYKTIVIDIDRYEALIRKEQLLEIVMMIVERSDIGYEIKSRIEGIFGGKKSEQH